MASFERVEVLKGPSALLNGVPPVGSVGGAVNLRSKVAGEMPLAELTPQFSSNSQLGGSADFSRRFGDDKAFGVRVNASYLNGDTPVDHQADRFGLITANLDYRGDRFRVNSTLHYQQFRADSQSLQYNLGPGLTAIPSAPKATSNAQQPWGFKDSASTFGTLRAEYDLTEQVTAFVAGGISYQRSEFFQTIANVLLNTSGDFSYLVGYFPQELRSHTGEAGLRGKFETGILSHEATISATLLQQSTFGAFSIGAGSTSNIYDPTFMAEPIHNSMSFPKLAENEFTSVAIADTISLLNKRMQFIVGGRLQTIETKNFNTATGIQTAGYRKQEFTPAVGVIVKPVENLSLYASYIEGLQAGLVSSSPGNFGQIFPPYVTKQKEIGAKYDFGTATVALAAFEITQPQALTDGIITAPDGEQRNRGIELTAFGTIADGVRALGGIMYVDGVQTKTSGGLNDGKEAVGTPKVQLNIGGEWDTPFVKGLTLTARVIYTSSQYVNAANTMSIPEWTRLDIGARYTFQAGGKPITVRASLRNALGADYWQTAARSTLSQGAPRTFLLSTTFQF
jgi:iron complex outermembrane receptor protein